MNLGNLIYAIEALDYEAFKESLNKIQPSSDEAGRLICYILKNNYKQKNFSFFKLVFDLLFDKKLNPNFIDKENFNLSLLCCVIYFQPQNELFDYLINKGANINLIILDSEEQNRTNGFTCLDFANEVINELIYDTEVYRFPVTADYSSIKNSFATIDKEDYLELIEASKTLQLIYKTSVLRDFIISTGGKSLGEIAKIIQQNPTSSKQNDL